MSLVRNDLFALENTGHQLGLIIGMTLNAKPYMAFYNKDHNQQIESRLEAHTNEVDKGIITCQAPGIYASMSRYMGLFEKQGQRHPITLIDIERYNTTIFEVSTRPLTPEEIMQKSEDMGYLMLGKGMLMTDTGNKLSLVKMSSTTAEEIAGKIYDALDSTKATTSVMLCDLQENPVFHIQSDFKRYDI